MNKEDDVNLRKNSRNPSESSSQSTKSDIFRESEDAESSAWSKYDMFFCIISYIVMFLSRLGKDLYKYALGRIYSEQVAEHILDLSKTSEKLHLENRSRTPVCIRHLTWIQRQRKTLRQYFRSLKSYMLSSEDDRSFNCSETISLAKDKSHLIPELPNDFDQNGAIIKTSTILPPSINNIPSTSKTHTDPGNNKSQNEKVILSDSDDDDSIVIAYLKDKELPMGIENPTLKKISVIEKVPKMETIEEGEQFAAFRGHSLTSNDDTSSEFIRDANKIGFVQIIMFYCNNFTIINIHDHDHGEIAISSMIHAIGPKYRLKYQLSETSLDVHIPSFPGSPRSLIADRTGSGESIESHDPYFAEAIEFLHEDKELLIAAETGNYKTLEILLRKEENIQQMDHLGRNALHLAVCSDSEATVMLLLQTKIKSNVKDNLGMTPLSLCLMRRPSYKIANLLFDHGAEITARSNSVDTGLFLQFVMMCTPTKEDARILELLVQKGALVNDPEAPGSRQALHFAAMSNNCPLIRILVDLGADLTLTNHRDETPRDVAQVLKCKEAYELLLELEEDVSSSSESQSSAI